MMKIIGTQLWNRKRSNVWIVIELVLVSCLVWYIVDYLFVFNYNKQMPNHRKIDHTWAIVIDEYKPSHPDYNKEASTGENREANYQRILQSVKNYPGVETIGVSFWGSTPCSGSYSGTTYNNAEDSTLTVGGQIIRLHDQTDFFKVFSYTMNEGKTPVSVQDFDWTNKVVLANMAANALFPSEESVVGKAITQEEDNNLLVVGVIDDVKRFYYERPQSVFYFSYPLDSTTISHAELSIRINPSIPDARFREDFKKEMSTALQVGNFYLKDVRSFQKLEKDQDTSFGVTTNIRMRTSLMAFFLLSILLCIIGTFWYRINVRKEEIGIRKALGATDRSILTSLLLEGLLLLTIAFIPAMIIEYQFVRAGLIETVGLSFNGGNPTAYLLDRTLLRFLITNGITWLIMAVVMVAATLLPAISASKVMPVEALRDE